MLHHDGGSAVHTVCRHAVDYHFGQTLQLVAHLGHIYHGFTGGIEWCIVGVGVVQQQYFVVGVFCPAYGLYKPAIAQRIGVAMHLSVVQHNVAGVEHVQHILVDTVADVEINQVLVAAQLGGAVSAHLVVECRGFGVVEGVHRHVQHTVVLVTGLGGHGVDVAVILCRLHLQHAGIANIVVFVQIAAVHTLQVDDCQHSQHGYKGQQSLALVGKMFDIHPQGGGGQHNEEDAPPRVAHKECLAVLDEDALYHRPLVAVLAGHLGVAAAAVAETSAHQQSHDDAAHRHACRDIQGTQQPLGVAFLFQ